MEIRENAGYKESAAGYKETGSSLSDMQKNVAAVIIRECPTNNSCRKNRPNVRKNIGDYCKVLPIIGMENPYHYRNKVHAVFDVERRGKHANGGRRTAGNGHSKAHRAA